MSNSSWLYNSVTINQSPFEDRVINPYNSLFADDTFTIENITIVTEEVEDWETLTVMVGIHDPKYKIDKAKQKNKDPKRQKEAILTLWYDTHPFASWSLLHQALSMMGETKAAQKIQELYLQG